MLHEKYIFFKWTTNLRQRCRLCCYYRVVCFDVEVFENLLWSRFFLFFTYSSVVSRWLTTRVSFFVGVSKCIYNHPLLSPTAFNDIDKMSNETCCICLTPVNSPDNALTYCNGCPVTIHSGTLLLYLFGKMVLNIIYFCSYFQHVMVSRATWWFVTGYAKNANFPVKTPVLPMWYELFWKHSAYIITLLIFYFDPQSCFLCPSKEGVLRQVNEALWAHVVCAPSLPGIVFKQDKLSCTKDETLLMDAALKQVGSHVWLNDSRSHISIWLILCCCCF